MDKELFDKVCMAYVKTAEANKEAKVRMSDVEDHIGLLDKKHEQEVRGKIKERESKSFALRHPVLTGIPTLGIAPLVAHARATENVSRHMLRSHPDLRKEHYARATENRKLDIEHDRANAMRNVVNDAMDRADRGR